MDTNKQHVLDFLASHEVGVISTIDNVNLKPESAVVGYFQNEKLELICATERSTRKWMNIQHNPHVSFVVWDGSITVQYEGTAREAVDAELEQAKENRIKKLPASVAYASNPDEVYFIVTPTWIRYADTTIGVENNFEIIFN